MEVLRIKINIIGQNELGAKKNYFNMLMFEGECNCEYFKGKTLGGAVDTQHYFGEGIGTYSARYMLEGVDIEGKPCKIFVQNDGKHEHGFLPSTPKVYTDSEALHWLEETELVGRMDFAEDGLYISICTKEE